MHTTNTRQQGGSVGMERKGNGQCSRPIRGEHLDVCDWILNAWLSCIICIKLMLPSNTVHSDNRALSDVSSRLDKAQPRFVCLCAMRKVWLETCTANGFTLPRARVVASTQPSDMR